MPDRIEFVKMHGCGNDHILLDGFLAPVALSAERIRRIAERRTGVGADGLILIKKSRHSDCEVEFFNADGGPAQNCGNGLRCVASYVWEKYIKGKREKRIIEIQTVSGIVRAGVEREGNPAIVTTNLGKPVLAGDRIPVLVSGQPVLDQSIEVGGRVWEFSAIGLGNPHCVIFVSDVENFPVDEIGPKIERHGFFPERTNVEFVRIISGAHVIQRTWERGIGETYACGSGAAAVCVAGVLTNRLRDVVSVELKGGRLEVAYDGLSVKVTGPAVRVYEGIWKD